MDFDTFNQTYGMKEHFPEYKGLLASVKDRVKNNDILIKTCIPYTGITNNFLNLLNATKSRKLYEVLNPYCEEAIGKFRWNQIFNICDAE